MKPALLTLEQYANLFLQLARLEQSGLPVDKAILLIADSDKQLIQPARQMQKLLLSGKTIANAGQRVGLFTELQSALINCAEASGTLIETYQQLAKEYTLRAKRQRYIKNKLYLPSLLLVLFLFIHPISDLATNKIDIFDYLQASVGALLFIISLIYFLLSLPRFMTALGCGFIYHGLLLQLPVINTWLIARQRNRFSYYLALLLNAGLDFASALPKAVVVVDNLVLRQHFNSALRLLNSQKRVSDILMTVPCLRGKLMQIIVSGEYSGTLAQSLLHFSQIEAEHLDLQNQLLAEWLPRIVYALVVMLIARSFF